MLRTVNFLDRLAAFDTEISIQIALECLQKVVLFDELGLLENLHLTLKTTEILEDNETIPAMVDAYHNLLIPVALFIFNEQLECIVNRLSIIN